MYGSVFAPVPHLLLHLQLTPKRSPGFRLTHTSTRGDAKPPGRGREGQGGTSGEDSRREKGLLRKSVSLQEGLREERAPRSSGNKQREVAPSILGQR